MLHILITSTHILKYKNTQRLQKAEVGIQANMEFCLIEKYFCKAFLNWARYPLLGNVKVCKCLKQNRRQNLSGNLPRDVLPITVTGHPDQRVLLTHSTHRMIKPSKTSPTLVSCLKTLIRTSSWAEKFPHSFGWLINSLLISSQNSHKPRSFLAWWRRRYISASGWVIYTSTDQQYTPNFKHYWIPNLLCVNGDVWLRRWWKAILYFSINLWLGRYLTALDILMQITAELKFSEFGVIN